MISTVEWYKLRLAEWETRLKEASEAGNYQAFQFAEREVQNYKSMLEVAERCNPS